MAVLMNVIFYKERAGRHHIERRLACPKCGAPPRHYCMGPEGRRVSWRHKQRVDAAKLKR